MTTPLTALRGVGARTAERLESAGISDVEALLWQFPIGYDDRREPIPIASAAAGERAFVRGVVRRVGGRRFGPRTTLRVTVEDDSGSIGVVYFNQPYRRTQFTVGEAHWFAGDVVAERGGGLVLQNPDAAASGDALGVGRIVPRYAPPDGIGATRLRDWIAQALDDVDRVPPFALPGADPDGEPWLSRRDALRECHRPTDDRRLERARARLRFEELFALQRALAARRSRFVATHGVDGLEPATAIGPLVDALPFAPTAGQRAALDAIAGDLASRHPMHRLVHGDVGCGKTVVAAIAAGIVANGGWQTAVLAPTEVLAEQWGRALAALLSPSGVECVVVTGRLPSAERRAVESAIVGGRVPIVVGTHALLSASVAFPRLGLVVVDEEQRFGVAQRDRLRGKGPAPHLLVLSATPIPRTLALAAYGDLDVTTIPDRPPGRGPRKTVVVEPTRAPGMWTFVAERIERGGRAFVVCPSIDAEAASTSAVATAEALTADGFDRFGIAVLHGRMASDTKAETVARFRAGDVRVLVATTVVEVGVDVPTADVIVIRSPSRFGLSQLHQLRGRVGRGERPSWCLAALDGDEAPDALARLRLFAAHDDGFRLAEADLDIRGPGELLGRRQHGLPGLRLADPRTDRAMLERARAAAFADGAQPES